MPRGGARLGAGRPAGSANIRTREIADRAIEEGLTPPSIICCALSATRPRTSLDATTWPARRGASFQGWGDFPQPEALWGELERGYGFLNNTERQRALRQFAKIDTAVWACRMLAEPLLGPGGDVVLRAMRRRIDRARKWAMPVRSGSIDRLLAVNPRTDGLCCYGSTA